MERRADGVSRVQLERRREQGLRSIPLLTIRRVTTRLSILFPLERGIAQHLPHVADVGVLLALDALHDTRDGLVVAAP